MSGRGEKDCGVRGRGVVMLCDVGGLVNDDERSIWRCFGVLGSWDRVSCAGIPMAVD